ncbi:hypothetical protein [Actinomycetospora cinnamomea]|uniref:Uncharacterized protein n=1 Tax=Actinomycetospora cinnamomea TaxID=663609 RepID=A0A2U1EWI6_9PSEU|nr:hypothetical protein [Actinomycetospora cinnamomea]PVZ04288.1 hypothetical protein C8D89_11876 [Actinomycetospora cinnamomea]
MTASASTSAPTSGAGSARGPWIASAALAVAIVVAAGLAVVTLVTSSSAPAAEAPSVAPAPPADAPPSPTTPPGAPATADSAGRALPAAVATGVQGLYTALGTGDLAGVQSRYEPSTAVDAAPWSEVEPLMENPANREALLAALREPPERRAGGYRYSAGGARVGVDGQGRMTFLLLP